MTDTSTAPSCRRKIRLYCFSGTGNTLWLSRIFAERMCANGFPTTLIPLPSPDFKLLADDELLAVAFPVYNFTAPPFVNAWLRALPPSTNKAPVILISTLAGMSGLVKDPFRRVLEKKGYAPLAVREFIMPPNYINPTMDEARNSKIRAKAANAAADFADAVASGKATWPWSPPGLGLIQILMVGMFGRFGAPWLGKGFHADKSKCSKCKLCVRLCPVQNIESASDGLPSWRNRCQQCLRCVNFCPSQAVVSRRMRFLYRTHYRCDGITAKDLLAQKNDN